MRLSTTVNGEVRQDGTTADMTWDVPELIRFVHQRVSFGVGDLLFTGTPVGVGAVKSGDVLEASLEKVGTLRVTVGSD